MHRNDGDGNDNGLFTGGDPENDVEATIITTDWLNAIQEELMSVLTVAGITPVKGTWTQVRSALYALFGRLAQPNAWTKNNSFTSSPVNDDGTDAGTFLQVDVAPGAAKRWCVFKLALGLGIFARLYISGGGSISLGINAAWSNTSATWTPDNGSFACVRAMLNTAGLQVFMHTSAGAAFNDATFTASANAVVIGSGGITLGGALGATSGTGPRVASGQQWSYNDVQSQSIFVPASAFTCPTPLGTTGGPAYLLNVMNGYPAWRAGDSADSAIATVVRLPEGATIQDIRWRIVQTGGNLPQQVQPVGYLVSHNVAGNADNSQQIHQFLGVGGTINVPANLGAQWYTMPLASGPFVLSGDSFLHLSIELPRGIATNGAGNGIQVRGVRVSYTYNKVRAAV